MNKENASEETRLFQAIRSYREATCPTTRGEAISEMIKLALHASQANMRAAATRWLWRQHKLLVSPLGAPAPKIEAL